MKKIVAIFAILIATTSFFSIAQAQKVSVNINIGSQPAWGPVGYDYVGYYYFPDIDVYYNVNSGYYNYYDRGAWVSAKYLPYTYANYDLYGLYKVVLDVNSPWLYNANHRRDYARYRGYRGQYVIRDSRDARYYNSRNNRVQWYSANHRPNRKDDRYDYNGRNNNGYRHNKGNKREQNRHNNNRPNSTTNTRQSYSSNNTRPGNQGKPNNHSQRNESVNRNNRSENTRNRTNNAYTSINYSENQTKSTTGRGR